MRFLVLANPFLPAPSIMQLARVKGPAQKPNKGTFRHIVFRDGDTWYAVALEFNIIESAEDPKLAFMNLLQAVGGYIESARKLRGGRYYSLNQKSDPEYEELWTNLNSSKPIKSPYQVAMHGVNSIS